MLINWFTVAAQIVNFLILVALLKRFLYGPIVAAMSAREGRIAAQLTEAQRKKAAGGARGGRPAPEDPGNRRAAPGDADRGRTPGGGP